MPSRAARRRLWISALALAAGLQPACSTPKESFIVLVLESSSTPITNVAEISVVASNAAGLSQTLLYSASDLSIVSDADLDTGTLSVSFSGTETGDVTFQVEALDIRGCAIGTGTTIVTIARGAINEGIVALAPGAGCTGDGGARDAAPGVTFAGCNPAGVSCASSQTCQIDCKDLINACTTAGTGGPGATCQSNSDCRPGSQCFDYTSLGCSTAICLGFCNSDLDCGGASDAGAGPGRFCRDPVACGTTTTAYHTCTFDCAPTAAAVAGGASGCPAGLSCLMPAADQVDCTCPESTRVGKEGAACSTATACAPGFVCAQTCHAICRCDARSGVCTAPNDCPTAGTQCTVVPNQTIYGICR